MTRATVGTAKRIVVNPSLQPTTLLVGAAVALVAPAVADLAVIQVAAPTVEAATCLGTRCMKSIGR